MKKFMFLVLTLFTFITLTSCDGLPTGVTLPPGVTLPTGVTTEETTTIEGQTQVPTTIEGQTQAPTTEPSSGVTTDQSTTDQSMTTEIPTTDQTATTETPTTVPTTDQSTTTEAPTTIPTTDQSTTTEAPTTVPTTDQSTTTEAPTTVPTTDQSTTTEAPTTIPTTDQSTTTEAPTTIPTTDQPTTTETPTSEIPAVLSFVIDDYMIAPLEGVTGDSFALPVPTMIGRTFAGWYLEPTFDTEVNWTTLPSGYNVIFGKWDYTSYTLTFETNGGTTISPVDYYYEEVLIVPDQPSKTDYAFAGWYKDASFTIEFTFTTMPNEDITIYAKWVDASSPNLIANQINQVAGSPVDVIGTIYAKTKTGVTGYLIYDETGYLAIDGDHSSLSIGDKVQVTGFLYFDGDIPIVTTVTSFNILSSSQPVPTPIDFSLEDLDYIGTEDIFKVFNTTGLLLEVDDMLIVADPVSMNVIILETDAIEDAEMIDLEANIGNQINMNFAIVPAYDTHVAFVIDYTIIPLTIQQQSLIIQGIIEANLPLAFYPGDSLNLNEVNPIPDSTISMVVASEYESYFDAQSMTFLDTDTSVDFPIQVTFTYNSQSYTFDLNVTLQPFVTSTIKQVIDDTSMSYHLIEGLVISKSEAMMILKDDTGYLHVHPLSSVNIGDLVILKVRNDLDYPIAFMDFVDGDLEHIKTVSKENELNLVANPMTSADVLALDPNDPYIYGQYVELTGFVREGFHGEKGYTWVLSNDDYEIEIMTVTHAGFETLFEYVGLEISIRGFISMNEIGDMALYFEGKRQDIIIPDYTDQERVDLLVSLFHYYFDGVTFDAFDYFEVGTYHPVLGGDISYEFSDPNFAYYNWEKSQFLYSNTDQTFTMNITVSSGTVSEIITFSSQVNAYTLSTYTELLENYMIEDAFVTGTVIYHYDNFAYLMNDLGQIIKVYSEYGPLDIYKGDEVLLYGNYYTNSYNNGIYQAFLKEGYDDTPMVLEIISRQNPITIPETPYTIEDIYANENMIDFNHNIYTSVEGRLIVDYGTTYLETMDGNIMLEFPNEQTRQEIAVYEGEFIELKGYLLGNAYSYEIYEDVYYLFFAGEPGDYQVITYTDQEKLDLIEAYILDNYQEPIDSGQDFDFSTAHDLFMGVDISYTTLDDTLNILDFVGQGKYQSNITVTELTTITIQVDLLLGVESSQFTFNFTIKPEQMINTTPIADLAFDGTSYEYIQVYIYYSIALDDGYLFYANDTVSDIYIKVDEWLYDEYQNNWNDSYVGDQLIFGGISETVDSISYMMADQIHVVDRDNILSMYFTPTDFDTLVTLNPTMYESLNAPIEITGTIYREYTEDGPMLYIMNDQYQIPIYTFNNSNVDVWDYQNYRVTLRGFVFYDQGQLVIAYVENIFEDQTVSPIVTIPTLEFGPYTDQEIINLIVEKIYTDNYLYNPVYLPGDFISYPSPHYIIDNIYSPSMTYTIIQGSEYVIESTYNIEFLQADDDQEIIVEITINVGSETQTIYISYHLNGFVVQTLDDLFIDEPGTLEIALDAVVLHTEWGLQYYLIDGQIYKLESFMYGSYSRGDKVYIIGYKTVIDGIPDYTYNIQIIGQNEYQEIIPYATSISIADLYTNDFDTDPLQRQFNRIYGYLEYDRYSNYYTLTDNGQTVYIRMLQDGWEYVNFLEDYIGEYVYLDIVLPMETFRNDYILVDTFTDNNIEIKDYTALEDIALIKDRIPTEIDVFAGDYLLDYLATEYINHDFTTITYTLNDPLDETYFDSELLVFKNIDVLTSIDMDVTITYDDSTTIETETFTITINIHPLQASSIQDILLGEYQHIYKVQGIIVAIGPDEDYIIIDDGTGRIYVDTYGLLYTSFEDGYTLAIGDDVVLIAKRHNYDSAYTLPNLATPSIIELISTGNTPSNTPTSLSIEDIITSSTTNITESYPYVEVSGDFLYDQYYYGGISPYSIQVDPSATDPYTQNLKIYVQVDSTTDLSTLNGLEVTITGYLIGYQNLNGVSTWRLIYESHTVNPV
jgi:uncharacterized repeat protein (TIGR02543 family)